MASFTVAVVEVVDGLGRTGRVVVAPFPGSGCRVCALAPGDGSPSCGADVRIGNEKNDKSQGQWCLRPGIRDRMLKPLTFVRANCRS